VSSGGSVLGVGKLEGLIEMRMDRGRLQGSMWLESDVGLRVFGPLEVSRPLLLLEE
jgi:hypothetical protein